MLASGLPTGCAVFRLWWTKVAVETGATGQNTPPLYSSLREWWELVRTGLDESEFRTVRGANSELDIGEITQLLDHTAGSPAVLFDEIPGFPAGRRVLVNANGTIKRQAVTLGLDPSSVTHDVLLDFWGTKLHSLRPLAPVDVSSGPITSNILSGSEIDLGQFPAPKWHSHAGGRYIGTASLNILRDPDSKWTNVGTYRNQVIDRNTVGLWISPGKHGRMIREKYFDRQQPCPIVIVVGSDPLLFMAACSEAPRYGMDEFGWAGAIRGASVEVVHGQVTGLPIPAHAEIALEGWVDPVARLPEGPYGEAYGYYSEQVRQAPFVRIERVYHRDDPILLGCPQGKPPHEDNRFGAYLRSSLIKEQLQAAGLPNVTGVWVPPEAGNRGLVVVRIKQSYPGHATQAGFLTSQVGGSAYMGKYVIVIDDDIDIYDMADVWWAVFTRVDPARDVQIIRRAWSGSLDQAIEPDHRGLNSRAIIDATRAWDSTHSFPRTTVTPELARQSIDQLSQLLVKAGS